MKIVITGHTNGIGKGIYEYFLPNNEIIGFSRSNGFDISNEYDRQFILHECRNADIFVNNAYNDHDDSQNILLKQLLYKVPSMLQVIINISSRAKNNNIYCDIKNKLNKICHEYKGPIHVINIRPGYVNTNRVAHLNYKKMSVDDVVYMLDLCITHKLKITEIEFAQR